MNLIDVDKLWADIEYWENHDDPKKPDYDTRDIEQVVGFQPLVDAIPVEWLIKVMDAVNDAQNYTDYETLNWLLDEWKNNKESFM